MAILRSGILGGFAGKVGTVVGSIWKGISTMRAYVANVTQPGSPAQLEQRAKFGLMMNFLKPLTSFLRIGFRAYAVGQTAQNAAFKTNFKNAITGVYPNFTIDYTKVLVSQGNFTGALNPAVASSTSGEVAFTWDNNSWETDAEPDDTAVLVVYNPIKQAAVSNVGVSTRTVGAMTMILPNSFAGDEVHCYIAFQNAKGTKISDSQYVNGIIVI